MRRIDVENAKVYDNFIDGMSEVNNRMKGFHALQSKKENKIDLPKLKKVK